MAWLDWVLVASFLWPAAYVFLTWVDSFEESDNWQCRACVQRLFEALKS